jgi:hypothetical protein
MLPSLALDVQKLLLALRASLEQVNPSEEDASAPMLGGA